MHYPYIILGGGVVAGHAARQFAQSERYRANDLAIISAEPNLPYDRPPLSKSLLSQQELPLDESLINPPEFYAQKGIAIHLNTAITRLDVRERALYTATEQRFTFDKLIIATGSHVKTLNVPGDTHDRVLYLCTLEQTRAIRRYTQASQHIVVIGGGFIAMEVTASLRQMDKPVTLVIPDAHLMPQVLTQELSGFFEGYFLERGVNFIRNDKPRLFFSEDDRLQRVTLASSRALRADLAVVGVGVVPNVELLRDTPVTVDDGLVVDKHLETSVKGIFAAGDVANWPDTLFDKRRRVEHWQNAVDQGQYLAQYLLGETDKPFTTLRYFFSDVFDLSYEFWGDTQLADTIIHRGNFSQKNMGVWWLYGDRLVAAFLMGRPDEERTIAQHYITSAQPMPTQALRTREHESLSHLLDAQ